MAYEIPGQMVTAPAGSTALAAAQYRFVTLDGTGKAILPGSTAGPSVFGVLQNKPANTEAASVMINGLSKVKATASTLAAGDLCAASSAGFAVPLVAGDYAVGRIVAGSSGGAGRVLTVSIEPIGTT
jgi:hypothetical protein